MKVFEAGAMPKKLVEFKDAWFSIAQKYEGLLRYKSGLNDEFRSSLTALASDLRALEESLDTLAASIQYHAHDSKEAAEKSRSAMIPVFRGLRSSIASDLDELKKYSELRPKLDEMIKSYDALRARHDDAKRLADKACEQYTKTKEEHQKRIEHIEEATARELGKIRDKFVSDLSPVFNGYAMLKKGKREELGLGGLFDELVRDPAYYLKLDVAQKGIRSLWTLASDLEARLAILQYKAEEVNKAVAPVIDETKRRIAKYEPEEKRVQEMGVQCNSLREEEKNLYSRGETLGHDVKGLSGELDVVREKYGNYGRFAEHIEAYIKRFGETTAPRKDFSELVEAAMGAYEPIEMDVEKRELRADLKVLKGEHERVVDANKKLREDLDATTKRLGEREEEVRSLNGKVGEANTKIESLSVALKKFGDENTTLKNELTEARRRLSDNSIKIRQLEDRSISLGEERNIIKRELDETKQLLKTSSLELDSARSQMREQSKRLVNLEEKSLTVNTERDQLESNLKAAKADLEDLRIDLEKMREEKESLRTELFKAGQELERMNLENKRANSEIASLQDQLDERGRRYAALREKYEKIASELAAVRGDVSDLEKAMEVGAAAKSKKPKPKVERVPGKKKADEEIAVGEKLSSIRPKD